MRLMAWMLAAVVAMVLCSTVYGGSLWTVDGAFDYESVQLAASWWGDPNGGIGCLFVTDSAIEDDTQENFALGPVVTFSMDPLYLAAFGTVFPAVDVPDVPAKTYGRLACTWDIDNDHQATFYAGTGVMFFPDRMIQPTAWTEYVKPEGESQEIRALFGVTIWLGKP